MNFDKKIFDLIANEKLGEMQTIYISELLSISSLAFIVIFVHLILKGTLLKGIEKLVESSKTDWDNKLFEKGISTKKQREEGGVIIGILNDVDDYRKEYCTTENSILIGQILLDK